MATAWVVSRVEESEEDENDRIYKTIAIFDFSETGREKAALLFHQLNKPIPLDSLVYYTLGCHEVDTETGEVFL